MSLTFLMIPKPNAGQARPRRNLRPFGRTSVRLLPHLHSMRPSKDFDGQMSRIGIYFHDAIAATVDAVD
jgi:hypothetical protein